MDQQAATLLNTLKRSSAASDAKLTQLNNLKSDIKHHRVPESAQPLIFECLKVAITQQSSSTLATSAFTTLGHLIKRLKIQDPDGHAIAQHAPKLFPALHERLGDLRENHRNAASQALGDMWQFCGPDIEALIRDDTIAGNSNARAKDTAMQWVVRMNREESLPFKGFVPLMVVNLEDHDGAVRDSAKSALIELFSHAPDRAKSDLKKQLNLHGVRTGIASQILLHIESDKASAPEPDLSQSTRSLPPFNHSAQFVESISSEAARPPPQEEVPMDPIFVHSQRELEDMMTDMLPPFEGRESEENWVARDKNVTNLRRLLKGNAPTEYHASFMAGMKQLQAGINKVSNSLRTTTSSNGCHLVQELARTLGPALEPMVEIYLQTFIKMCAATKNIAAQNGNQTVDNIFQYVSYNIRTMQHIWLACQEKNVQPRTFAAGWLVTILDKQAGTKSHFESSGGLELAEKIIKHGLNDAQPKVKEAMRGTYWSFAKIWPNRADLIMNTLDTKAKLSLEKDSHNPNAPTANGASMRGSTMSRAGGAASRTSIRDAMLAAKKSLAKSQSERPSSAMATVSPAPTKSKSNNNLSARQPAATTQSARVPSSASNTSNVSSTTSSARPNALMSGAARRPSKRTEIARPATADPYSSRRLARPETPSTKSPLASPRHETAVNTVKNSTHGDRSSPVGSPYRASYLSPRPPVQRSRPSSSDGKPGEPASAKEDDFTLVAPHPFRSSIPTSPRSNLRRPSLSQAASVDSGIPTIADDDNFTMELPAVLKMHREQSPLRERRPSHLSTSESVDQTQPALPNPVRRVSERRESPVIDTPQESPRRPISPPKEAVADELAPAQTQLQAAIQLEETDFHIHEDPFMEGNAAPGAEVNDSQEVRNVLNEVPVNESAQPENGQHTQGSPPQSPQNKTEMTRSRKLLLSGIERIRGRTLDAHGFRKVLELVKSSETGEIFGSVGEGRRFDDLCNVLLDYIVEPSDPITNTNVRHTQELRRQATSIMRTVLNAQQPSYRKWVASGRWYSRTLTSALEARKNIDGSGLLVKDLEALATDIVSKIHPEEGEKVIVYWLEQETTDSDVHQTDSQDLDGAIAALEINPKVTSINKATALALRNLTALLASTTATAAPLSTDLGERSARLAVVSLRSKDAEVRKSAVELATQLHASWPMTSEAQEDTKSEFWNVLEKSGLQESARNLIVYFIARKERGSRA